MKAQCWVIEIREKIRGINNWVPCEINALSREGAELKLKGQRKFLPECEYRIRKYARMGTI
jgi:hypothetical protein